MEVFKFGTGAVVMAIGMGSIDEGPYMPSFQMERCKPHKIGPSTPEELAEYQQRQQPDTVMLFPTLESLDNVIGLLTKLRSEFQPIV